MLFSSVVTHFFPTRWGKYCSSACSPCKLRLGLQINTSVVQEMLCTNSSIIPPTHSNKVPNEADPKRLPLRHTHSSEEKKHIHLTSVSPEAVWVFIAQITRIDSLEVAILEERPFTWVHCLIAVDLSPEEASTVLSASVVFAWLLKVHSSNQLKGYRVPGLQSVSVW